MYYFTTMVIHIVCVQNASGICCSR